MKKMKKILAVLCAFVCLASCLISASAVDYTDSAYDATTKWVTGFGVEKYVYSKPMYTDEKFLTAASLGLEPFQELSDIYAYGGYIYILDAGAGRIDVLDANYNHSRTITSFKNGEESLTFKGAQGIYVFKDRIYLCDKANNRVIISDMDCNVIKVLTVPETEVWPDDLLYNPVKIVVDNMDYIYVLCEGSFYGAAMYTPDYEFKGFFGANTVTTTVFDAMNNLWDMLFTNNVKLSKKAKALPFSFVDMVMGADGYIYTCTGAKTTGRGGAVTTPGTIRRLNPTGSNILVDKTKDEVSDSANVVFSTKEYTLINGNSLAHNFTSIAVDENNYIYVLDAPYGKVYVYDIECNLLTTFGGGVKSGVQEGTFRSATALAVMDGKAFVLDSVKNGINIFTINEYGLLVQEAQTLTIAGDYNDAKPLWEQVLAQDRNSIIAYRGIAKAAVLNGEYSAAMDYALMGYDRNTYSQAFEYVRTAFMEKHFTFIFIGAIVLVVAIIVLLKLKKKHNVVLIKNHKVKIALGTLLHPADTFYEIKRNKGGSVLIATVILALWYAFKIIGYSSSFVFNSTNIEDANAWYSLAQTFGLVLLFTLAHWLVAVLFEGKAKLVDIYVVTCYAMIPMVIQAAGYDILSNVLTLGEASFISMLNYVCIIYAAILLIMGLINVQEFTFGKFLFTIIVTLIAMILVIFIIFLVGILVQQSGDFIRTLFLEAFYR